MNPVAKYFLLPGIVPRFRELFGSGFGMLAYLLAQILAATRLLPRGHPYLNASHIGSYGIRHVMGAGAANLKWQKKNIDQIAIYFLLLTGLVILALQMALLLFAVFAQSAYAQGMPTTLEGFFLTPDPTHDIAHVLLDRVFGIENIFNSCVARPGIPCFDLTTSTGSHPIDPFPIDDGPFPWPFHEALHDVFELYSTGILIIALLILAYFILVILTETAQTGTPFGKRFNHVWAPIRLVVAIGLLVPVASGLNSGQYIALYAAKFGSGFATNGWNLFVGNLTNFYALPGDAGGNTVIAVPEEPDTTYLGEFLSLYATCSLYYERAEINGSTKDIRPYIVKKIADPSGGDSHLEITKSLPYADALQHYAQSFPDGVNRVVTPGILIAFGEHDTDKYKDQIGYVNPYCGQLFLPVTSLDDESGAYYIQEEYYNLVRYAVTRIRHHFDVAAGTGSPDGTADPYENTFLWAHSTATRHLGKELKLTVTEEADPDAMDTIGDTLEMQIDTIIRAGAIHAAGITEWQEDLRALGWGGAAIWYNKVAQMNGSLVAAAQSLPIVRNMPVIMQNIAEERRKREVYVGQREIYQPVSDNMRPIENSDDIRLKGALMMWETYDMWTSKYEKPTNNIFIDTIRTIFGTHGLMNIHSNANENVHPLALLSGVGKSLIESAITNLGLSAVSFVGGGMATIAGAHNISAVGMMASSFFLSVAMIGIGAGFILFYILPFLPFLYFFFAVGKWIKTIFEAMVGIPLWALAHIRIDGEGLPGEAALSGYYLIFEIFLRPILIVFGLLAGIAIFSAQVKVLHEIWDLVTSNVAGFHPDIANKPDGLGGLLIDFRQKYLDQFFFTIIYAIMVYLMAMASFKLIDLIPNSILRWMGANVQTFADQSGDPAENLVRNTSIGMNQVTGTVQAAHGSLGNVMQNIGGNR